MNEFARGIRRTNVLNSLFEEGVEEDKEGQEEEEEEEGEEEE